MVGYLGDRCLIGWEVTNVGFQVLRKAGKWNSYAAIKGAQTGFIGDFVAEGWTRTLAF